MTPPRVVISCCSKRAVEAIVLAGGDLRNEAFYCGWEGKNWQAKNCAKQGRRGQKRADKSALTVHSDRSSRKRLELKFLVLALNRLGIQPGLSKLYKIVKYLYKTL
jgi:hypothetical protein